jgi:hypothetical protein
VPSTMLRYIDEDVVTLKNGVESTVSTDLWT